MPQPNRRDRLNPEDLAKKIAERLSESGAPKSDVTFSLRNSVLVGRLISGLIIVALAGGLAFAVTIGVNWFMGRSDAATGEIEAIYPEGGGEGGSDGVSTDTTDPFEVQGVVVPSSTTTTTTLAGPFATPTTVAPSTRATLPPTTTTTTPPSTTATTVQSTTSSSTGPATTQPPSTSPPTTATTAPTTTTTLVTTTTLPSTTTLPPDTTAPVFAATPDLVREATGPSGATVTFAVAANDAVDGPVTPVCLPSSGSLFALGTTTVDCSATDSSGNTANASFDVSVEDTTEPVITLAGVNPVDIPVDGTYVEAGASATDLVDGSVSVGISGAVDTSTPGTYIVTYTATDSANNTATDTRTVNVS